MIEADNHLPRNGGRHAGDRQRHAPGIAGDDGREQHQVARGGDRLLDDGPGQRTAVQDEGLARVRALGRNGKGRADGGGLVTRRGVDGERQVEARLARLLVTVAVTVTAMPPALRVTVQLSPAATGPRTSKLRDTDTAAAGATPIFVVKITPDWLMTTRSLPSAIARKPSGAPVLIAAARLFAISSSVGRRIPGVVELPSMSMRATT